MWVVYVLIVMFIAVITKCMYDSVYGKSNDSFTKDDLDENIKCCEGALSKVNSKIKSEEKPRISPPVYSMLELMMKDPDGFIETWDAYYKGIAWKHKESSICFTKKETYSYRDRAGKRFYYINLCSITEQEGEYLMQGVKHIESHRKRERDKANKEHRHEVDRKIREVLEENNL